MTTNFPRKHKEKTMFNTTLLHTMASCTTSLVGINRNDDFSKPITLALLFIATPLFFFAPTEVGAQRLPTNESFYYTDSIRNVTRPVTGITGRNSGADSETLERQIEQLSMAGGGTLVLRKHRRSDFIYLNDVMMRSNVHLKIASGVTIRLFETTRPSNPVIFRLQSGIENVAITSIEEDSTDMGDWFQVDLTNTSRRVRFINCIGVSNFKIAGILVFDNATEFSNIEFNIDTSSQSRRDGNLPTNGVVKNVLSMGNHVGYGVVQIRAGRRILFKNLEGFGGVTLRIESGFAVRINRSAATIEDIVGRGITIRDGDSALTLSPHRVNQGVVDIRGIRSFNSGTAVQLAAGFLDNKGGVNNRGSFSPLSVVRGISRVRGGRGAQVKTKDFKLYPCGEQARLRRNQFDQPDGESTTGRSLAAVRSSADSRNGCIAGCYRIRLALPSASRVSGVVGSRSGSDVIVYSGGNSRDTYDCP